MRETQGVVDSREFCEWQAYRKLDPWGQERGDMRSALVASVVANAFRGKGRPFTVDEFMLRFHPAREKRQTEAQIERALMFAARLHNERLARSGNVGR